MRSQDHHQEITNTPEFRREVRVLFRRHVFHNRHFWAGTAAYILITIGLKAMSDWLAVPIRNLYLFWLPQWAYPLFMSGLISLAMGFICVFLSRKLALCCRWEALNNRGITVCMHCGYDLRGQTEPRCPECGKAFAIPQS